VPPKGSIAAGGLLLALFIGLGVAITSNAPWVVDFNATVGEYIRSFRSDALNTVAGLLNVSGDVVATCVLAIVILAIIALNRMWDDFIFVAGNIIFAEIFFQICKLIFAVQRPQGVAIVDLPIGLAFPSAHTASTILLMGIICMLLVCGHRKNQNSKPVLAFIILVLILLAVLMGISRVYLGVHWPTDIIGSFLVAGAWLCPTIAWFLRQYPYERFHGGHDPYGLKGKHVSSHQG